jgi:hypothetical protein
VVVLERKAIIVWHYYKDGKVVNYSTTRFKGDDTQLDDCLKNDVSGKRRNEEKKEGDTIVILHQVVLL